MLSLISGLILVVLAIVAFYLVVDYGWVLLLIPFQIFFQLLCFAWTHKLISLVVVLLIVAAIMLYQKMYLQ